MDRRHHNNQHQMVRGEREGPRMGTWRHGGRRKGGVKEKGEAEKTAIKLASQAKATPGHTLLP